MNSSVSVDIKPTQRVIFIDLLRIIACFFVIVNHTNSQIFQENTPSALWFLSLSWFFLSKCAVPVFLLITGYTLLDRQDSYPKSFLRLIRHGCCLILFSAVYYLYSLYKGHTQSLSLINFLVLLISGPITNAYWYFYMYLGLLVMMPFLQKMVSTFQKADFHLFFFWSVLFYGFWPMVTHYIPMLTITDYFSLPLLSYYIFMPVLGCYLKRYTTPPGKTSILYFLVFLATCACNVLLTYWEYLRTDGVEYLFFEERSLLPMILGSVCLFRSVSALKPGPRIGKIILEIGKLTFGIFLLSDLVLDHLEFIYTDLLTGGMYPMVAMLIYELAVFVGCAILVWPLKKIPGIKSLI